MLLSQTEYDKYLPDFYLGHSEVVDSPSFALFFFSILAYQMVVEEVHKYPVIKNFLIRIKNNFYRILL